MAKVSIIVPAYNCERFIAKCLDSLLAQSYKDYEIIVVDNNSIDRTPVIVDEYAKNNTKISSISCKKQGVSCARNAGLKAATGDFVSFVDSDDYIDPDMFTDLMNVINDKKVDIAVCGAQAETESGELIPGENSASDYTGSDPVKRYLCLPAQPFAKLIRRTIIVDHKVSFNEDISLGEDLAFVCALVSHTDKIGFVNKNHYHYIMHDNSLMHEKTPEREAQIFTALNQVYASLSKDSTFFDKNHAEIERIFIANLVLSSGMRYMLPTKDKAFYDRARNIMIERFPNWWRNKYYAKRGKSMRVYFNLYRRGRILAYSKLISRIKR